MSNTEDFVKKSIAKFGIFLDYSKTIYVSAKIPIILICPNHAEFSTIPNTHLNNRSPCPKCNSRYIDTSSYVNKAKLFHKDNFINFDYSNVNYIDYYTKINLICNEHGPFSTHPCTHLKSKYGGCQLCSGVKKLSTQQFKDKSNTIHNFLYDYSESIYKSGHKKLIIICPIHGKFNILRQEFPVL